MVAEIVRHGKRWVLRCLLFATFSTLTGFMFAQTNAIDLPGVPSDGDKIGSWGLVGIFVYWTLFRLSKQLDELGKTHKETATQMIGALDRHSDAIQAWSQKKGDG